MTVMGVIGFKGILLNPCLKSIQKLWSVLNFSRGVIIIIIGILYNTFALTLEGISVPFPLTLWGWNILTFIGFTQIFSYYALKLSKLIRAIIGILIIMFSNAIRDFTHVKDTVNAYILASEKGEVGEPYNVCSEKGISVANYIKLALKIFDIKVDVFVDPDRMRSSEVPLLIGKNKKFVEKTGWYPIRSIIDIIKDGVEYFQNHPEQLGIEAH